MAYYQSRPDNSSIEDSAIMPQKSWQSRVDSKSGGAPMALNHKSPREMYRTPLF
jgi:hypothetical protein